MGVAVYNSANPNVILNTVNRALWRVPAFGATSLFLMLIFALATAHGVDWSTPEQQLAHKVIAVTGPGAVALTVDNRSSLTRRENEIVQNGFRAALEALGIHFVKPEQAAATVTITLSENLAAYVWVAEIRQAAGENAVVMVSTPRPEGPIAGHD